MQILCTRYYVLHFQMRNGRVGELKLFLIDTGIIRVQLMRYNYFIGFNTKAMKWAEGHFNIRNMEDWYSVTSTQLEQVGLTSLMQKFGGIHSLLQKYYATFPWDFPKVCFKDRMTYRMFVIKCKTSWPVAYQIYFLEPWTFISIILKILFDIQNQTRKCNLTFSYHRFAWLLNIKEFNTTTPTS